MEAPSPDDVRAALAALDPRCQKIVAGLLGAMIRNPNQVYEREWIAQQLAEVTVLAGEFEADTPDEGVHVVEEFLEGHATELLNGGYLLFQRVGLDLAPRVESGFTFEEAMRRGLDYLPSIRDEHEHVATVKSHEMGEQPLARLMAERGLSPKDLVAASDEQLTHKMVARAMRGRRLTANTMGTVHRAWNKATEGEHRLEDLFDYEP